MDLYSYNINYVFRKDGWRRMLSVKKISLQQIKQKQVWTKGPRTLCKAWKDWTLRDQSKHRLYPLGLGLIVGKLWRSFQWNCRAWDGVWEKHFMEFTDITYATPETPHRLCNLIIKTEQSKSHLSRHST